MLTRESRRSRRRPDCTQTRRALRSVDLLGRRRAAGNALRHRVKLSLLLPRQNRAHRQTIFFAQRLRLLPQCLALQRTVLAQRPHLLHVGRHDRAQLLDLRGRELEVLHQLLQPLPWIGRFAFLLLLLLTFLAVTLSLPTAGWLSRHHRSA